MRPPPPLFHFPWTCGLMQRTIVPVSESDQTLSFSSLIATFWQATYLRFRYKRLHHGSSESKPHSSELHRPLEGGNQLQRSWRSRRHQQVPGRELCWSGAQRKILSNESRWPADDSQRHGQKSKALLPCRWLGNLGCLLFAVGCLLWFSLNENSTWILFCRNWEFLLS